MYRKIHRIWCVSINFNFFLRSPGGINVSQSYINSRVCYAFSSNFETATEIWMSRKTSCPIIWTSSPTTLFYKNYHLKNYIGWDLSKQAGEAHLGDGRCLPGRWEIDRWEMSGMSDGRWTKNHPISQWEMGVADPSFPRLPKYPMNLYWICDLVGK